MVFVPIQSFLRIYLSVAQKWWSALKLNVFVFCLSVFCWSLEAFSFAILFYTRLLYWKSCVKNDVHFLNGNNKWNRKKIKRKPNGTYHLSSNYKSQCTERKKHTTHYQHSRGAGVYGGRLFCDFRRIKKQKEKMNNSTKKRRHTHKNWIDFAQKIKQTGQMSNGWVYKNKNSLSQKQFYGFFHYNYICIYKQTRMQKSKKACKRFYMKLADISIILCV